MDKKIAQYTGVYVIYFYVVTMLIHNEKDR